MVSSIVIYCLDSFVYCYLLFKVFYVKTNQFEIHDFFKNS